MTEDIWHTLVVRAWRDRDGLKVRFMADHGDLGLPSAAVDATVDAAVARFVAWLEHVDSEGRPRQRDSGDDATTTPGNTIPS